VLKDNDFIGEKQLMDKRATASRGSIFALFFVLGALSLQAQSSTATRFFGGYSYQRLNSASGSANGLNGWVGEFEYKPEASLSLVGDVSGEYGCQGRTSLALHTFSMGPRIYRPVSRFDLFAHALFGTAYLKASNAWISDSSGGFSTLIGGGVDVKLSSRLTFRIIQPDYQLTKFAGRSQNNLRLTTGILFRVSRIRPRS
jgi:hypothetical protein